jgi:hypothetical protein
MLLVESIITFTAWHALFHFCMYGSQLPASAYLLVQGKRLRSVRNVCRCQRKAHGL